MLALPADDPALSELGWAELDGLFDERDADLGM
jgi:hypothetical protein